MSKRLIIISGLIASLVMILIIFIQTTSIGQYNPGLIPIPTRAYLLDRNEGYVMYYNQYQDAVNGVIQRNNWPSRIWTNSTLLWPGTVTDPTYPLTKLIAYQRVLHPWDIHNKCKEFNKAFCITNPLSPYPECFQTPEASGGQYTPPDTYYVTKHKRWPSFGGISIPTSANFTVYPRQLPNGTIITPSQQAYRGEYVSLSEPICSRYNQEGTLDEDGD